MKKYIILFLVIAASMSVNAQSMWNLTYEMAFPAGVTKDFANDFSFRGFSIDGRKFINKNITLGGTWSWNVLYERRKQELYDIQDNVQIHGDQFRTGNYMPFMMNGHYYLGEDGGVRPFIGTGAGIIWKEELMQMGVATIINDNAWQFGFTPEVGIFIPAGNSGFLYTHFKYTYGVATGKLEPTSYFTIGIGIGWENF